jgi:hypothetical protein
VSRTTRPVRLLVAALTVGAVLAPTVDALAVQTDTFGLAATGGRVALVHRAGGGVVHDGVDVYNRTSRPLLVQLVVVGVHRASDGRYLYGASGAGLAADIRLSTTRVDLPPHATRMVPVTIRTPSALRAPEYAAILASGQSQVVGALSVRALLGVFVEVTPNAAAARRDAPPARDLLWAVVAAALAVTVGAALVRVRVARIA